MKRLYALLAMGLLASPMAALAGPYNVTVIDYAGGTDTTGWDINNVGVFVGNSTVAGQSVAFLLSGGVTTTLTGPAGAVGTGALGISDGGIVVGSYSNNDAGTANQGFILNGGIYTTLNLPGATDTYLRGISPNGRYVTGYAQMGGGSFTSFVYDRTSSSFTAILPNSPYLTIAQGVTDAGVAVGNFRGGVGGTNRLSFTYDIATDTLTDFSIAGGDIRYRGINESGLIDGFFVDGTGVHGFIGSAASYDVFNVPGATDTFILGINNAGWLAGDFIDANGAFHAFLATPTSVPEPATLGLLGLGLAGIGFARKRKAASA